jgi:predicted metalloprotease with PDZ domain
MTIRYIVTPQTAAHHYLVKLIFTARAQSHQLTLPVWIPGSYMVREFSKNIITLGASQNNQTISSCQIDKNNWLLEGLTAGDQVEVSYTIYAYEYGIRTAFLDAKRGYFNPTSLCLSVAGYENNIHQVQFADLPDDWQVACGLAADENEIFSAQNYDELIDSPFELGAFERLEFSVAGVNHYLILSGTIPPFDRERMISDMHKICDYQIKLFGGVAPYTGYGFILNLSGEIYTGLEHRNSTLLMAPYYALPNLNRSNDEDYIKLLGLISHEFFHTWNVKRIKPQVFTPYNLGQENYTKLLWWFEGVTSYYDDLVLYRSGVINQEKYLSFITDNLNNVYKFAGVTQQTLANSSLTSWIKYYRQDENSPNSIVSYYVKGSLVALCLDLLIREQSKFSLDDVMRHLFKQWQQNPVGVGEDEIPVLIKAATGVDLAEFIHLATETTESLPFKDLLAKFGLNLTERIAKNHQDGGKYFEQQANLVTPTDTITLDLGAKLDKQSLGYQVKNVYDNTPAQAAGLAAGDLIVALNNVKLNNLEKQLAFLSGNEEITLTLFRQEQLLSLILKPTASVVNVFNLVLADANLLANWL